jgi:hypothetical protein
MALYKIGDRVDRIEDRPITGATIIAIQNSTLFGVSYELEYDEGGTGWWPEDCLKPIPST